MPSSHSPESTSANVSTFVFLFCFLFCLFVCFFMAIWPTSTRFMHLIFVSHFYTTSSLKLNPLFACFSLRASGRDPFSAQSPSKKAGLSSTPMYPPPPPPPLPQTLPRIKEVAPDHRWVILQCWYKKKVSWDVVEGERIYKPESISVVQNDFPTLTAEDLLLPRNYTSNTVNGFFFFFKYNSCMHSDFQNAFMFILNLNVFVKFSLTVCLFLWFLLVIFLRQNQTAWLVTCEQISHL